MEKDELLKLRATRASLQEENKRLAAALSAERADGEAGDTAADLEALLRAHSTAVDEYELMLDAHEKAKAQLDADRADHERAVAEFFAAREGYNAMVAKLGLEKCTVQMELSDLRRAAERLAEHETALAARLADATGVADRLQRMLDSAAEARSSEKADTDSGFDELAAVRRMPATAVVFLFGVGILKGVVAAIAWRRRGICRCRWVRNWIVERIVRVAAYGKFH